MKYILSIITILLLLPSTSYAVDNNVVRLSTSSSLSGSGLTDLLIPAFKKASGYDLMVYPVGSGRAIRMGRLGQADVVIAHPSKQATAAMEAGDFQLRVELMKNNFVLVGPANYPAGIKGSTSVAEAFNKISKQQSLFVSRADNSGNHNTEMKVWKAANLTPGGHWYRETGERMLPALAEADKINAYLVIDYGSWLKNRKQTSLVLMVEGDPILANPYDLIATSDNSHPGLINHKGKRRFLDWILSGEGRSIISNMEIDGQKLYQLSQP